MSEFSSEVRILRPKDVSAKIGLSRTTIWRAVRVGDFPSPLRLSGRAVGWLEAEVEEWIDTRARIKSET